ncbi:MAG: DUF4131 domain-containing protein, partial [Rubrivivax sp.]
MSPPLDTGVRLAAMALSWLLGIGLQLQQPALWQAADYIALCAAACLALALCFALDRRFRRREGAGLWLMVLLLALALLGFGSTGWRATQRLAQTLPTELEGQDLQLTGVIAALPQLGPQGTRFVFDVEQAVFGGQAVAVPRRIALGW